MQIWLDDLCSSYWKHSSLCIAADSVEALSQALSDWGEDYGALVIISHDRAFCEKVGFTHVCTVADQSVKLEERSMTNDDWQVVNTILGETGSDGKAEQIAEMDPVLRKKLFNAPKRIAKIEELLEKAEADIASLEEEMIAIGSDVGRLVALSKEKEKVAAQIQDYMEEWEELEALLAQGL